MGCQRCLFQQGTGRPPLRQAAETLKQRGRPGAAPGPLRRPRPPAGRPAPPAPPQDPTAYEQLIKAAEDFIAKRALTHVGDITPHPVVHIVKVGRPRLGAGCMCLVAGSMHRQVLGVRLGLQAARATRGPAEPPCACSLGRAAQHVAAAGVLRLRCLGQTKPQSPSGVPQHAPPPVLPRSWQHCPAPCSLLCPAVLPPAAPCCPRCAVRDRHRQHRQRGVQKGR